MEWIAELPRIIVKEYVVDAITMFTLDHLPFNNSFIQLDKKLYSRVTPQPLENPRLVLASHEAASLIDLDITEFSKPEFVQYMNGTRLINGSEPIATKYTGHQFGHYNPDLGDGRALLLGEVINSRDEHWELQLKGSGQTPYSRFADGRAVLRSSIREFLASEALHALGIPTSRALCLIASDTPVYRECLETGAMILRMAPSHVRFGHFEYLAHTNQHELLKSFTDYVIQHDFAEFVKDTGNDNHGWFTEIVRRNAELMAQWQAVGFAHGVMNTDNMSILGITFDYGPFGFVDDYDPHYICNHSDDRGRYAFDQQAGIMLWNLHALALALQPVIPREILDDCLDNYREVFFTAMDRHMRAKLGLQTIDDKDRILISDLLQLMESNHIDYTLLFRDLSNFDPASQNNLLRDRFIDRDGFDRWAEQYTQRLRQENSPLAERQQRMNAVNPKYILRNYLAQIAIDKAEAGDYSEVQRLHNVLKNPFKEQAGYEDYAKAPPDWGKHLEISCSS
jgi:uncharacterized protein YdiU (UPF0061 family)